MQEGFTRREKLVGLFLLVMVIITKVTLLVLAQGKGWFASQRTYNLRFKQGYNLKPGSLVKMFNTEIGKVSAMRISRMMDENQVEVTIKILTEYADLVRQDSVGEVVSPTLIGSEFVDISPGSSGYPPIPEYGTIPSRARKTLTESLAEIFNEDTIKQARQIFNNLAHLSEQLKTDEKALLAALTNFGQAWKALNEGKGTLGELLMRRDFLGRMNQSLAQLDKALQEAQKLAGNLQPSARNLEEITKAVNKETETLKAILADLRTGAQEIPALVETTQETVKGGKDVVDAVKANPLIRMTLPKGKKGKPVHVDPRQVP